MKLRVFILNHARSLATAMVKPTVSAVARPAVSGIAGPLAAAVALAGALVVGATPAFAAGTDPVSNPDDLTYSNVEMKVPDYDVPFKRYGAVSDPSMFSKVVEGMPAPKVQRLIGQPLSETDGSQGPEWNYNFTLVMPESHNYIVCQYKVVFDANKQVKETVWRRHQCLDIVNQGGAVE